MSSLPVPDSPRIMTGVFVRASCAIEEQRFPADARHDDRPSGLADAAGDALAQRIPGPRPGLDQPVARLDVELLGVLVQHRDETPDGSVVLAEDFEHPMERGL